MFDVRKWIAWKRQQKQISRLLETLNPGSSKGEVQTLLGDPESVLRDGKIETWQYDCGLHHGLLNSHLWGHEQKLHIHFENGVYSDASWRFAPGKSKNPA